MSKGLGTRRFHSRPESDGGRERYLHGRSMMLIDIVEEYQSSGNFRHVLTTFMVCSCPLHQHLTVGTSATSQSVVSPTHDRLFSELTTYPN